MNSANAQSIKVTGATSQGWAGGICCRHGRMFTIYLKIEHGNTQVMLDSLWLNGYCIGLQKYNRAKFKKGETEEITIIENLIFDDEVEEIQLECKDPNKSGIIFTYYLNKKKKRMDVSSMIKELDFLAYP